MVILATQSNFLLNLTLNASSWMITFPNKDMNYALISGKRNTKEEVISPKLMT